DPVQSVGAAGDGLAVRHRDHGDVRVEGAGAVALDQLVLGALARLSRQREVQGQPVAQLAGGDAAEDEGGQPEQADDEPVTHDEASETLHGYSWPKGWAAALRAARVRQASGRASPSRTTPGRGAAGRRPPR